MYITLIIFLIGILGFLLHRKNIISQTSKFLILENYPRVDLIGPTFTSINEGLLILKVIFPFTRFMVSGFKFFFSSLHPSKKYKYAYLYFFRMEIEKEFNFYFFNKKIKIFGREVSGCSSFQSFGG